MKVKVGNTVYDGEIEPVMVILSMEERRLIANMGPDITKYCSYPDSEEWVKNDFEKIKAWMEEND